MLLQLLSVVALDQELSINKFCHLSFNYYSTLLNVKLDTDDLHDQSPNPVYLVLAPLCCLCWSECVWLHDVKRFTDKCLHIGHVDCQEQMRAHTSKRKTVDCPVCRSEGVLKGLADDDDSFILPEAVQDRELLPEDRDYEVEVFPSLARDIINAEDSIGEMSPDNSPTNNRYPYSFEESEFTEDGFLGYDRVEIQGQIVYLG